MFRIVKLLNGRINYPETVLLPTDSSTAYEYGCALLLKNGELTVPTATEKPTFLAAASAAAGARSTLPVCPLSPDVILEAPVSATPTSLTVGDAVTLNIASSQAVGITATTTSGVATIWDTCGAAAAGDRMQVRFL